MSVRWKKFEERLKTAFTNAGRLLRGEWNNLRTEDRKAIVRSLITLIVVTVLGAVGLLILSSKPKRRIQANLACSEVQVPVPLITVINYGTERLMLWEFEGTAERTDRDSIDPKPPLKELQRSLTLQFVKTSVPHQRLDMLPESPGQMLNVQSPAATKLTIEGEDISNSQKAGASTPIQLRFESGQGGISTVTWQVDSRLEIAIDGLEIKPLGFPPEEQMTFKASPFADSAIDFSFKGENPNAKTLVLFERHPGALRFDFNKSSESLNIQAAGCSSGTVRFGETFFLSLTDVTEAVQFNGVVIEEIDLRVSDFTKPKFALKLSGEAPKVLFGKEDKNPTRLEEILSAGFAKQTIFGILVLGVIYVLGHFANRALEVFSGVILPEPKDNGTPRSQTGVNS